MWSIYFVVAFLAFPVFGDASVARAYEVAEVANGATIAGRVAFQGNPPAPRLFEVQKDAEVCGQERTLVRVAVDNGFLQGAVIVLEGVTRGKPFASQRFKGDSPDEGEFRHAGGEGLSLEVKTKRCSFGPFTGVVTANEPVRFLNQDPMRHTLHTFVVLGKGRILRTLHNKHINRGEVVERTFQEKKLKDSRVVRIACNRHDFMQNWFYVVKTPYFSISDQDGNFTIDQVPPGQYELVAWHPVLGVQKQRVTVGANENFELNLEFSDQ